MLDEHQSSPKPVQTLILLAGILALLGIGIYHAFPPQPSPLSAPLTSFSATRAMSHVWQIGSHPHPAGTRENAEVRQYLLAQLNGLGLEPEIQSALLVNPEKNQAGRIHNVLVRIPGTLPGKALLLSAHYDSVHTGPGAADNGASVAAILETLRAIKTQPALQNDLICLFTDAEETGLLGAEAFVRQHPWAKNTGLAMNFEYRGNRGAFMMFETSQGNGKLIEGLAASTPFLLANSLMYEVYKRLPNDTDLTVFKQAGIPGMNFAAIEGHTSYHTQLDRPELLDQGSLQHEGDIMVALAKQFGNIPPDDLKSTDRVYFDAPGLGLVNYPVTWVMPLNLMLLLLFARLIIRGLKTRTVRIRRAVAGLVVFPLILLGLAVFSHLLWLGICQFHPEYGAFFQGDTYNSRWYLLAFVFLNFGWFTYLQVYIYNWMRPIEFSLGVMAFCLMLSVLTGVWLPGASFLLFWPLAAMLMAVMILSRKTNRKRFGALLVFLGSVPGILLFTPLIKGLFAGLTPQMVAVVVIFLLLLLGLITPLLEAIGQRQWLIKSSLLFGLAALVTGSLTSGFDAGHPRQNTLFYALDSVKQQAYWLSPDKELDQWNSAYFPNAQAKRQVSVIFGDSFPAMWAAPAPVLALPAPKIETLEDSLIHGKNGDKRKIKIRIKSSRNAPKLKITIEGIDVIHSKVAGQLYSQSPQSHWSLNSVGLLEERLIIEFMVKAGVPFRVRAMDISYGFPEPMLNPRPSSMISKPSEYSDTTVVVSEINL